VLLLVKWMVLGMVAGGEATGVDREFGTPWEDGRWSTDRQTGQHTTPGAPPMAKKSRKKKARKKSKANHGKRPNS
jgi:hypothetical protein